MSDPSDLLGGVLSHGLSVAGGGGIAGVVVRFLFADVAKRLDRIEKTIEEQGKQHDTRHESMIERLARVESKADAAHRRIDELPKGRKR